jgi:hypothetical protein
MTTTPSKKRKTMPLFCSALSLLSDASNNKKADDEKSTNHEGVLVKKKEKEQSQSTRRHEIPDSTTTRSNATTKTPRAILTAVTLPIDSNTSNASKIKRDFSLNLNTRGLKYYVNDDGEEKAKQMQVGDTVLLVREPDNEFDANAIRVCFPLSKETIGHIGREQSKLLAFYNFLDHHSWLALVSVKVAKKETATLQLCVKLSTVLTRRETHDLEKTLGNAIDVNALLSKDLANMDLEASQSSPFKLEDLKRTQSPAWRPLPDFESAVTRGTKNGGQEIEMGWLDGTLSDHKECLSISVEEATNAQSKQWPPPASILSKLGIGRADDTNWWKAFGLLPPSVWVSTVVASVSEFAGFRVHALF